MKIRDTLVHAGINRKIFSHSSRSGHIVSMGRCKISFLLQMKPVDYLGHSLGTNEVVVLLHLLRSNSFKVSWEISVEECTEFIL